VAEDLGERDVIQLGDDAALFGHDPDAQAVVVVRRSMPIHTSGFSTKHFETS